jgi:hypothetical protein
MKINKNDPLYISLKELIDRHYRNQHSAKIKAGIARKKQLNLPCKPE